MHSTHRQLAVATTGVSTFSGGQQSVSSLYGCLQSWVCCTSQSSELVGCAVAAGALRRAWLVAPCWTTGPVTPLRCGLASSSVLQLIVTVVALASGVVSATEEISSRQILFRALLVFPVAVRRLTALTCPSDPVSSPSTTPKIHLPRGKLSSHISTTSPVRI